MRPPCFHSLIFLIALFFYGTISVYGSDYSLLASSKLKDFKLEADSSIKDEGISFNDTLQIDELVVNSPFFQERLRSVPGSISLINSQKIEKNPTGEVSNLLNQVPGVFMHQGTESTSRISIRGIGSRTPYHSNRVKAYLGFVPLSSLDGTTVIEDISIENLASISLIKGPKSALYGAGLGGIIQLNPPSRFASGLHGKAKMETGSFGHQRYAASISNSGTKSNTNLAYSYYNKDGYRENSGYKRHNIHAYGSYQMKEVEIDFMAHLIDLKAYIPSSLSKAAFDTAPESAASNWLGVRGHEEYTKILSGMSLKKHITSNTHYQAELHFNWQQGYESRPFNILDDQSVMGGIRQLFSLKGPSAKAAFGFEYQFQQYQWEIFETVGGSPGMQISSFDEFRQQINLFGHVSHSVKNWDAEVGLNLNKLWYKLNDDSNRELDQSGKYSYAFVLSPFAGINWQASNSTNLYASIGHGFSPPSVEEALMPEGEINTELLPESGYNLDIGIRHKPNNSNVFLDIAYYWIFLENLLVTERIDESTFMGENAGKTQMQGIELSALIHFNKNQLDRKLTYQWRSSFSAQKSEFKEFMDDGVDYQGKNLPGIPKFNFTTKVNILHSRGYDFGIEFMAFGKQYMDDGNQFSYPGHNLVNIRLDKGWQYNSGIMWSAFIAVNNVFDTHYASMILINAPSFGSAPPRYYYPGVPRNFKFGVELAF